MLVVGGEGLAVVGKFLSANLLLLQAKVSSKPTASMLYMQEGGYRPVSSVSLTYVSISCLSKYHGVSDKGVEGLPDVWSVGLKPSKLTIGQNRDRITSE